MNAKLVFACATSAIAMAILAPATASAETEGTLEFEIYDDQVNRGDRVTLFGSCYAEEFPPTPVESDVLDAPDLTGERMAAGDWYVTSSARVKADAPVGTHPVSYQCGDSVITRNLEIHEVAERREIAVVPDTVKPGQQITIRAFCTDESYGPGVPNAQGLLVPMLARSEGATVEDPIVGFGSVATDAKPGKYEISFLCGDWVTGEYTIVAANAATTPPTTRPVAPAPQVPVKPKGAADTGSLDPADSNTGAIALTLGGLAVFAGAGGLLAYRRRHQA
jgi:LPXTG-motif cell wall-anchored protein